MPGVASTVTIGARTLAESVLVQPLAVLAGWLLGTLVPGRPAATEWLVPLLAVVTTAGGPGAGDVRASAG